MARISRRKFNHDFEEALLCSESAARNDNWLIQLRRMMS